MIAILAATAGPTILCLTTAYALRGQTGRHTGDPHRRATTSWNPLPESVRADVRRRAARRFEDRTPFVNSVNTEVAA